MIPLYRIMAVIFFAFVGAQLISQSPKTFYVGHSLSDQIPDMVQSLSNDHATVNFSWVYQSIPGAPLRWQWDRKDVMDYTPISPNYYAFYDETYGLPSAEFDVLVLTESVPRYPEIINETFQYADSFYRYATTYNPDTKVYLYEDWHCILSGTPTGCSYDIDSNPWRQRLVDDLPMWESVVDTLNNRYNPTSPVCMIPAGQGLVALYDSIQIGVIPDVTDIEDLFSDNIHLNDIGKYFIACIHFATIHEASPVGLTNQLQYWWGGDFEAPSPSLALKFQQIAWETANNYPRTCLKVETATDILANEDKLILLPNPTTSIFEIQGLKGNNTIQILDAVGNIYQTLESTGLSTKVDIETLPSGLYFIKVKNHRNNQILVKQILKQS